MFLDLFIALGLFQSELSCICWPTLGQMIAKQDLNDLECEYAFNTVRFT